MTGSTDMSRGVDTTGLRWCQVYFFADPSANYTDYALDCYVMPGGCAFWLPCATFNVAYGDVRGVASEAFRLPEGGVGRITWRCRGVIGGSGAVPGWVVERAW